MAYEDVWARVKSITGWKTQMDLAGWLDIKQGSVSGAKQRDSFPLEWAFKIAQGYNVYTDWIMTGEEEMHRDDRGHSQSAEGQDHYVPDHQCEWDRQLMGDLIEWLEEGLKIYKQEIIPVEKRKLLLRLYDIYSEEDEAVTRKDIHRDLKLVIGG